LRAFTRLSYISLRIFKLTLSIIRGRTPMRSSPLIYSASVLVALAACASGALAQQQDLNAAPISALAPVSASGPYLAPGAVSLYRLLPPPPAAGSAQERAELDELLQLQGARTPAQAQRARDDANVSIFRFADALGSPANFTAEQLPLTARLFARITKDESQVIDPVKDAFDRPRPFLTESRLSPVVPKPASASYPSGHSTWAASCAIVLADMVPERRAQIFARADEYAHNREVGGVHYPSDVAGGQLAGTALATALFMSPRFVADEVAAAAELRRALGLPPLQRLH
jgi:acid phosphatase (class A)